MESPQCRPYSLSSTGNAETNVEHCRMYVCPGVTLQFATCHDDGKTCSGDTYLRLFRTSNNQELAFNDDHCGYCSKIVHTFDEPCQEYSIVQGCFEGTSCEGTVRITQLNAESNSGPMQDATMAIGVHKYTYHSSSLGIQRQQSVKEAHEAYSQKAAAQGLKSTLQMHQDYVPTETPLKKKKYEAETASSKSKSLRGALKSLF